MANQPASGADVENVDNPAAWSLAQRIDHLFETVRRPDGTCHSNKEVAAAMGDDGSKAISGSYLWLLRNGQRDNPTKRQLEALAKFFGVRPAYFFDDVSSQAIAQELALLRAMKKAGIQHIAARLSGLSPRGIDAITHIIEAVRAAEGLPEPDEDTIVDARQ